MFQRTKIKLTTWYLLIIMFVSVMFSMIIYRQVMQEVYRFEQVQRAKMERSIVMRPFMPLSMNLELIEETRQRLIFRLLLINLGILITSGGLGYVLAGKTLNPIKLMVERQQRFVADASHELRTPLTSLKSGFEVFLKDPSSTVTEAKVVIHESLDEVNRLQRLSENLLDLSRSKQAEYQKSFVKISLVQIIEEACKRLSADALKKQITFETKLNPASINGNHDDLLRLVIIILENAIKYSGTNSKILISNYGGKTPKIQIIDQGPGIDAHDLPYIFDRFYRSDKSRKSSGVAGYGLGLSIAKNIAEMHGADIEVRNTKMGGASFKVNFRK